jgi:predicted acylesterase/phospholipase RssA
MNDSLHHLSIWLSGSIPDEASPEEQQSLRSFIRVFAKEVFRQDGRIVHGSHPSIRDTLLQAAAEHQQATGDRARLVLAVSRYFSKEPAKYGIDLPAWHALCVEGVIETREALADPRTGETSRKDSLGILRHTLAEQCNAIVAIGGKWWKEAPAKAGVPEEMEWARANGLPLFLLGGLGGSTRAYLQARPELLRSCANGLTEEQNLQLAQIDRFDELARAVIEQLARLPLRSRGRESGRPFRILSLDGGGIRGAFTAAVLQYWEKATRLKTADHFDLIAGTSTGGILAIGLGMGMPAEHMVEFYRKEGGTIFPVEEAISGLWHSFRHWFGAKFDQSVLREKLETAYKTAPIDSSVLDHSLCRLVIPAYNSEADTLIVFRTPHGSGGANDAGRKSVEVALATAAAPTYFSPIKVGDILAVDGGVWANAPTTIALAEATRELHIPLERVEMLSIGTTSTPTLEGQPLLLDRKMIEFLLKPATGWLKAKLVSFLWKPSRIQGKLGWLPNIAGFLMKTQAQTADYVCRRLLGDRFVRVDASTVATELDDVKAMDRLIGLANDVAAEQLHVIKTRFLNGVPADKWKQQHAVK